MTTLFYNFDAEGRKESDTDLITVILSKCIH